MDNFAPDLHWSDLKLNSDGMVPVIVQDYRTDEVLMLAYMNEEAFNTTINLGKDDLLEQQPCMNSGRKALLPGISSM